MRPNQDQVGSLNDFLALSRAAGDFDSESEFTVDFRHAFESLKKFTLAENGGYVRFLVASAIARGATCIELETSPRRLRLRDNGAPLQRQQLEEVFPSMLAAAKPENMAQRYLAAGLWGARSWGFHQASVSFPGAGLLLTEDRAEVSSQATVENHGWNLLTVIEKRSVGNLLGSLMPNRGWEHLKAGLYCLRYARARITLNGVSMTEAHPCHQGTCVEVHGREQELAYSGHLAESLNTGWPASLVVHGICYETKHRHSLSGLVYCDQLKLDASFQGLVQDRGLSVLLRSLRERLYQSVLSRLECITEAEAASRLVAHYLQAAPRGQLSKRLLEHAVISGPRGAVELNSLVEIHDRTGGLVVDPAQKAYQPLLDSLFATVIYTSHSLSAAAQELLATPAVTIHGFDDGAYLLRLAREPLESPSYYQTHFFSDQEHLLAAPLGPDGFQLVCLKPGLKLAHAGAYLERKILEMGNALCQKVDSGLVDSGDVAPFFTRVLHWLRSSEQFDARFNKWRHYLRFRREPGVWVAVDSLKREHDLTYRLAHEPEAPYSHCLVLTTLELDLLEWEGLSMRPHEHYASGRIGGMRVIELTSDEGYR